MLFSNFWIIRLFISIGEQGPGGQPGSVGTIGLPGPSGEPVSEIWFLGFDATSKILK